MVNNYIAVAACTLLLAGALALFGVAAHYAYRDAARWLQRKKFWVQRSKVAAGYVPNAPLTPHNVR